MRTFHGKKITVNANAGRQGTSVSEEKFSASEELRRLRGLADETAASVTAQEVEIPAVTPIATPVAPVKVYKHAYISPTFTQKILACDEVMQERYDELKNYALRFSKLKSRLSRKFDSINLGRLHFVKISVAGKTLKLYLNMDIKDTEPKYHCADVSKKVSYATVPVLLRIKSERGMRYAKRLIDQCAEAHSFKLRRKKKEFDSLALAAACQKKKDEKFRQLHPELFPNG